MKQNLILKTALAVALGSVATSAFAGVASPLPKTFASPIFGAVSTTSSTAATVNAVTNPAIAIAPVSYATAVALSPNTTYYVYVKLNNGAVFATGKPTNAMLSITDVTGTSRLNGGVAPASPNIITNVGASPTISADGTYAIFPINIAAGQNPLQINSTITFTADSTTVTNVGALATPGNTISASISIGGSSNTNSVMSDVDTLSTGIVAKSALPLTATLTASDASAFAKAPFIAAGNPTPANFLGQIDAANAQAKLVTAPTGNVVAGNKAAGGVANADTDTVDFGAITLATAQSVYGNDGVTPYVFSNTYTGGVVAAGAPGAYPGATYNSIAGATGSGGMKGSTLNFTVTGNFGAFAGSANKVWLDVSAACTNATAIQGSVNAAGTAVTFTNINNLMPGNGTADYVGVANSGSASSIAYLCGQVDSKTVITPMEPAIASFTYTDLTSNTTATITPTLVNGAAAETTGLYNLAFNGGVAVTPIYVSKAGNGLGSMFVRVINTGYNAAPVTLSVINDATGKTGTQSGVVTTSTIPLQSTAVSGGISIPAQGAIVLSTSDIENIIGTVPSTSMPRLMFTAPTNLAVQTYVLTSQGAFSELDPVTGLTR